MANSHRVNRDRTGVIELIAQDGCIACKGSDEQAVGIVATGSLDEGEGVIRCNLGKPSTLGKLVFINHEIEEPICVDECLKKGIRGFVGIEQRFAPCDVFTVEGDGGFLIFLDTVAVVVHCAEAAVRVHASKLCRAGQKCNGTGIVNFDRDAEVIGDSNVIEVEGVVIVIAVQAVAEQGGQSSGYFLGVNGVGDTRVFRTEGGEVGFLHHNGQDGDGCADGGGVFPRHDVVAVLKQARCNGEDEDVGGADGIEDFLVIVDADGELIIIPYCDVA